MQTVIATTTFYGNIENCEMDKLRFGLTCKTIKKARNTNRQIIIVNGSPNPKIAETMKELGALVYPETLKGMGASRRLAFFYALHKLFFNKVDGNDPFRMVYPGNGIIIWIEPEKTGMIQLIPKLTEPIMAGVADIVIMKRSEKSFQTYPAFQVKSEKKANKAYEEATSRKGYDPMSGPVAFKASVLQKHLFLNPNSANINDTYIQHYIPLLIPKQRVSSVEVDFMYPPDQKSAEEAADNEEIREKRQWQMKTLSADYHRIARALQLGPYVE